MSKQNKDIFDKIDEYFSTIDSEEIAKKITKGVDDLSKNISDSIEESFKKQPKPNFFAAVILKPVMSGVMTCGFQRKAAHLCCT